MVSKWREGGTDERTEGGEEGGDGMDRGRKEKSKEG